ncbi:MAG: TlpA disulfide reductase family protein [Elusimicrobiales bacterium]
MRFYRIILLAAVLAAGCSGGEAPAGRKAPDFALNSPRGASLHLQAAEAGGPVLVVFWSVYCGACRYMVPLLNALQDKYGGKGLSVIAVSIADPAADVAEYGSRNGLKYPLALDGDGAVARLYGVRGTPTSILVDKDGTIRKTWVGYSPAMDSELDTILPAMMK